MLSSLAFSMEIRYTCAVAHACATLSLKALAGCHLHDFAVEGIIAGQRHQRCKCHSEIGLSNYGRAVK